VLVPTTVLAAQHFRTFSKRFADYPVTVEMISRYRDDKQIREILQRAREGKVDVLIGTTASFQRTSPSRTWGWWWWTRSSASASSTRSS